MKKIYSYTFINVSFVLMLPFASLAGRSSKIEQTKEQYSAHKAYQNDIKQIKEHSGEHISIILDKAKKLLETYGDKGLSMISKENKKLGDHYIVVLKHNGATVIDPNTKETSLRVLDIEDAKDSSIVKMILEEAKTHNGGWIHYRWTRRNHFYPEWKTSKVINATTPSGKKYILVSGCYDAPVEDMFIVDFVDDFIALFEKKDRTCFAEFENDSSRVHYDKTYIFMLDSHGKVLFNPPFPSLESRNMYNYKDFRGKYVFRDMINLALKKGSGWIEFYWELPNSEKGHLKLFRVYVKKINYGNRVFIVGAGYFPEKNNE